MSPASGSPKNEAQKTPTRLWLPVFALFTLHNLEEVGLDLPAWGRAHDVVIPTTQIGQSGFTLVIAGLSAALVLLAYALRRNPSRTRMLLLAFVAVMVANFVWHIGASLVIWSVQPEQSALSSCCPSSWRCFFGCGDPTRQ